MKKLFIVCFLGIMSTTLFNTEIFAQEVTNNDVKIAAPIARGYKDTDWVLLGQTKAYKAAENQVTGELYVRFISGKFFYKFTCNGETFVVNPIKSIDSRNLEFQQILLNCNAMVNMRAGLFYLAVPTW